MVLTCQKPVVKIVRFPAPNLRTTSFTVLVSNNKTVYRFRLSLDLLHHIRAQFSTDRSENPTPSGTFHVVMDQLLTYSQEG